MSKSDDWDDVGNQRPVHPEGYLSPDDIEVVEYQMPMYADDDSRYLMIRKEACVDGNVTDIDVFGISFAKSDAVPLDEME